MRRALLAATLLATGACITHARPPPPPPRPPPPHVPACPPEMVQIDDYCIDKWEAHVVELGSRHGDPLLFYRGGFGTFRA